MMIVTAIKSEREKVENKITEKKETRMSMQYVPYKRTSEIDNVSDIEKGA